MSSSFIQSVPLTLLSESAASSCPCWVSNNPAELRNPPLTHPYSSHRTASTFVCPWCGSPAGSPGLSCLHQSGFHSFCSSSVGGFTCHALSYLDSCFVLSVDFGTFTWITLFCSDLLGCKCSRCVPGRVLKPVSTLTVFYFSLVLTLWIQTITIPRS